MIVATFHGPNHFVPNYDESTIEVFENIGHAISALFDRYDTKGEHALPVRYLNGGHWRVPFAHVELGDSFDCFKVVSLPGEYPPNEQAVQDALTAVHLGSPDYRLTLMKPFGAETSATNGTVSVSVQKY